MSSKLRSFIALGLLFSSITSEGGGYSRSNNYDDYCSSRTERKTPLTPKQKKAREKSMRAKKARRKQRKANKK
jgi:hypothetical protein